MNHRLGAAIAALAMITVPAISMAGPSSWAVVTGWNQNEQLVSALDHLWSQVQLRHTATTVHQYIPPSEFPPGPCKQIAQQWDFLVGVQNAEEHHQSHHHGNGAGLFLQFAFEAELNQMADHQCKITYVGGTTNGDGSTNLNTVAPSP